MYQTFDPLLFLSLSIEPSVKEIASEELLIILAQYLCIRLAEEIPSDQLQAIHTIEDLFRHAQNSLPHFQTLIKHYLSDFKQEYQLQTGIKY